MADEDVSEKLDQAMLRDERLKDARDAMERVETGLQNAQETTDAIRSKQSKTPRRKPNTPDMPEGDPESVTEEEWVKYADVLAAPTSDTKAVLLDPITVLKIELVASKKRAAIAEEKLALLAVRDAKKSLEDVIKEEEVLLSAVYRRTSVPAGKSLRLVDKNKGLCLIED